MSGPMISRPPGPRPLGPRPPVASGPPPMSPGLVQSQPTSRTGPQKIDPDMMPNPVRERKRGREKEGGGRGRSKERKEVITCCFL